MIGSSAVANCRQIAGEVALVREKPAYSAEMLQQLGILGLHCGSGTNLHARWLNTDVLQLVGEGGGRSKPGRIAACEAAYYLQHDAAQPFPLADESLPRILAEHFIEHLPLTSAVKWLGEMRRLLAPGGVMRISTPDLAKYVRGYLDPHAEFYREHRRRLDAMGVKNTPPRRAWAINQIFYGWGHRWIYDADELVHAASLAGFAAESVRLVSFRQGSDPLMAELDLPVRNDESLYVEIVK